ncbi:hypothetical protein MJL33_34195, partial [Salmonella enterica subsp. enterica serovar Kentucky]|nr:hypothetical protein [Salmonella enterica subsp. enterica serovar Kentucky]
IDEARFKRPVVPGDQMIMEVTFEKTRRGLTRFKGVALVDGKVDRKYSSSELIHTWSDLAGLTYDGYDPTRSITNPQFKETTRW